MKSRLGMIASIFLLLSLQCIAQSDSLTDNVLTTKKLRYGIYRTFNEFKSNSPSITSGFEIFTDSNFPARCKLKTKKGKIINEVYGFSDGKNIFISTKTYSHTNYFVPILAIGKITYFEDIKGKANSTPAYSQEINNISKNPGWIIYIPDGDGLVYALSRETIYSILKQNDRELSNKFSKENSKDNFATLMNYMIEFNKKNSNWK